jgi:tetratricopeptide (TPR) repeat protein
MIPRSRYGSTVLLFVFWGMLCLVSAQMVSAQEEKTPAEIEKEARTALEKNQSDPELYYRLGNALYDQGRREEAIENYQKAIELRPDYVKAIVNLGVVLNENSQSEEALRHFEKAEELAPNDVTVLCNKGQALYALQRHSDAIDLYLRSMELEPKNQLPYYLLGVAFADAGIYREAIREWEKVVAIDPETEAGRSAAESIDVLRKLVGDAR